MMFRGGPGAFGLEADCGYGGNATSAVTLVDPSSTQSRSGLKWRMVIGEVVGFYGLWKYAFLDGSSADRNSRKQSLKTKGRSCKGFSTWNFYLVPVSFYNIW